jgi:Flp pilus assembly protein TadG
VTIKRQRQQRGSAMVEFTLSGIALLFTLICVFEVARGMWIYHTLAHASKEATRYLIVHGTECQKRATCDADATLGALASRVTYHGVGLLPQQLEIQVYVRNNQIVGSGNGYVTMSSLAGSATRWSDAANLGQPIQVGLRYPFRSALAMLWPGAGRVNFTLVTLGARSWDTIQF